MIPARTNYKSIRRQSRLHNIRLERGYWPKNDNHLPLGVICAHDRNRLICEGIRNANCVEDDDACRAWILSA